MRSNSGPGDARLIIAGAFGRAAAGLRRIAEIAAAAGVHRRHQLEARRIAHMRIGARHHRLAGLDRLAQRVQHRRAGIPAARPGTARPDAPARLRPASRAARRRPAPPSRRNDADCGTAARGEIAPSGNSPASDCTMEISSASRASSGGSRPGRRCASIDLPAPGGPIISRLWPPAAAISSARLARFLALHVVQVGHGARVVGQLRRRRRSAPAAPFM